MDMSHSGLSGIFSVPDEHIPGLAALALIPIVCWLVVCAARATAPHSRAAAAFVERITSLSTGARVALVTCLVGAVVHAAIVPTHWGEERRLAVLFVIDAIIFTVACVAILLRHVAWRVTSLLILGGTVVGYALYLLAGWEEPDLVGLLTTSIELAGFLVLMVPEVGMQTASGTAPARPLPRWLVPGAAALALFSLLCTSALANASASEPDAAGSTSSTSTGSMNMGSMNMGSMNMGSHGSKTGTMTMGSGPKLALATHSPAGAIRWPVSMPNMSGGMKMVTPNCTAAPTATQQRAAVALVNDTVKAAAPFKSLAAAKAAGYRPVTPTGLPVVHYINPTAYMLGRVLDAASIPVLVYVNTPHGAVLSAAMYLMPLGSSGTPPQPGGCLTEWHVHTNLCFASGSVVGLTHGGACAAGSVHQQTRPMMHVWMIPVPGGPLSPDPSATSEVLAASRMPVLAHPNGRA